MIRLWHLLISGHQWELKAQTQIAPNSSMANWRSSAFLANDDKKAILVEKYAFGWSEALLICPCGKFTKIELIGNAKTS